MYKYTVLYASGDREHVHFTTPSSGPLRSPVARASGTAASAMAGSSRLHLLPLLLLVVSSHVSRTAEESHEGAAGEEGERLNSEVHVAKLELERVLVPLIITLFVMVVVLAKMGERGGGRDGRRAR